MLRLILVLGWISDSAVASVPSHVVGLSPAPLQNLLMIEILLLLTDPPETPLLPPASDLAVHPAQSPPPPPSQSRPTPPVPSPPSAPALLPAEGDQLVAVLAVDHPVAHVAPEVESALGRHGDASRVSHPAQPLPGDVIPLLHLQSWCLLMP